MTDILLKQLEGKKILLLGFGREGQSCYRFIRRYFPQAEIGIADQNTNIPSTMAPDIRLRFHLGDTYLDAIRQYDMVIKSPGVSLKNILADIDTDIITSQTDLFLQAFHAQCIGVTGTKGKSTTSSLIYHILHQLDNNTVYGGNIGLPLFELIDKINPDTHIVLELSSHQLEFLHQSPHIGILLNLFEEHLDHYNSFKDYQRAKYNIALHQNADDYFIYHHDDVLIQALIREQPVISHSVPFAGHADNNAFSYYDRRQLFLNINGKFLPVKNITDTFPLKGTHNYTNAAAAIAALACLNAHTDWERVSCLADSFSPLRHRMEYVGTYNGILFYNDSISTIPQATIAAVKALGNVDTLILGGMDRGIDYSPLAEYISHADVRNFIFTGKAGKRMMQIFENRHIQHLHFCNTYSEIITLAMQLTQKGKICLLSPAASSYDSFKNFEQRGDHYKELIQNFAAR